MLCNECFNNAVSKLISEDFIILDYLIGKNATIPPCSISRTIIKGDTSLSEYKCYTSLDRLELFDLVSQQGKSKSSKYFITESGKKALILIEKKMGDEI